MNTTTDWCSLKIEPKEIFLPMASNTFSALAFAIVSASGSAVGCARDIGRGNTKPGEIPRLKTFVNYSCKLGATSKVTNKHDKFDIS